MATIHISEIQRILAERGEKDALQWQNNGEGYFVEIRFDSSESQSPIIDDEMKNRVITGSCAYGFVTIQFDDAGELQSIDLS